MIPKRKIKKILTGSYELPNNVRQAIPSPVVQVQTITYQHAPYIRDCIEGVLMQKTNFPFEYLIGEDCSTDGTREIVFEYAKKHPEKIRVITADENFGMMGNIRRCRMAARGKYIALCEGDDYWTDPYKLQKHVDFMEQNPGVSITYHDACKVDADKNIIEQSMLPEIRKKNFSSEELKTGIWILTYTMCFRNLIDQYPENYFRVYNGDTFLTSLLGNYGSGAYLGHISPSCYRVSESGVFSMKTGIEKMIKSLSTSVELMKFYKQRNDKDFYEYFINRIQKALLEILEQVLSRKNKNKLALRIIKLSGYLGLKNSLYYLKKLL
ncbi:MAG TPA: glycosyltransferase [Bacteroidales bacterium]|nr:glycosyltransferase [Bacteroidales bacterium]HQI69633.1 glycosyltransferase [Bacteroidales bacterium]